VGALTFDLGRRPWLWPCILIFLLGASGCSPNQSEPSAPPTTSTAQQTTTGVPTSETVSTQPPTSKAPPTTSLDPAVVVRAYFAAINAHDYRKAWQLGGKNFSQSYADFVRGFADTEHDMVTVLKVDGSKVTIRLVASESGGHRSIYQGTYIVGHGELVAAHIRRVSGPPPTTQSSGRGGCDPSYPDTCLLDGIGDYDCAGGRGDGPNYVKGPIRVLAPDPFDLDSNGNGWGCES
jgi:hypothetical protein